MRFTKAEIRKTGEGKLTENEINILEKHQRIFSLLLSRYRMKRNPEQYKKYHRNYYQQNKEHINYIRKENYHKNVRGIKTKKHAYMRWYRRKKDGT